MPEHVSILQCAGVVCLALVAVAWVTGLARMLRRERPEAASGAEAGAAADAWAAVRTGARPLAALPQQRNHASHVESVELTPAEQAAFAGLIRQFADGH
ncbi:hypothetical protein ACWC10_02505 [Streptomyces sp. NPDC001595]|uniref:hypothetical protein n=1 Tax=Streptomyces sp. NPDC001532 TaxID=3154520 RepID=UPI003327545F